MPRYINEHSQRFGALLKRGKLNQQELASEMSLLLGWIIHPSYISRWLHGKRGFSLEERQAMVRVLYESGSLKQVEDRLWLGELLALDEAQLRDLVPLSRSLLTNLPPPDDLPYLTPDSYVTLKERLAPGPIPAGRKDHHLARFLALSGPPGSGKTALLVHLAADDDIRRGFPAILYANLADRTEVSSMLQQWLVALGEMPAATDQAREILRRRLAGKRLLLLLDDLPDARLLPDLLVGDEGSRIVVTCSRDVAAEIGIPAEAIISHRGWDGPTAGCYLEALWGRALTARERSLALELNELVGGLPLFWMVLIPWLHNEQSWRDLRDEIAAAPLEALNWPHGRLRASLMAAYRRLPEPAQLLFGTLGVFAPGAPFRVEAVAAMLDRPVAQARRGLHALDQASFLQTLPASLGESHRQMHRLLHHLALELAMDNADWAVYCERHMQVYAEGAYPVRQEQNSPGWPAAVQALLPDLPNVRLGQERAADRRDPLAAAYFLNVGPYLVATREMDTYQAWGQAALPGIEAEPDSLSAVDRLAFYGQLPDPVPERRRAHLERALAIAREEIEEHATAYRVYALLRLARFLYGEGGRAPEAEPVLVEALSLAAEIGSPDLETHVLADVAYFFLLLRDRTGLELVADRLPASPPAMHAAGLSGGYYHGLRGDVLRAMGRWAEAAAAYDQIMALHDAIDDQVHGAEDRLRRAICRAHMGDVAGQEDDLAWVRERLPDLPPISQVRYQLTLSELALQAGNGAQALATLRALPEEWQEDPDLALETWLAWRQAYLTRGRTAEARVAADRAQALARARGFTLHLEKDMEARQTASAAPILLRKKVGGRPPLF